ncbi:MAG TPA: cupin domain-containing protein [Candidatus Micrarchaeia archaeon]|nr:cupin domain-containing protein [Candidatus Micrarchaeia archaeon]
MSTADAREPRPAREYTIGQAARLVGVSSSTLRLWEQEGLVRARRTLTRYRVFTGADIARLRVIRRFRQEDRLPASLIRSRLDGPGPGAGTGRTPAGPRPGRPAGPDDTDGTAPGRRGGEPGTGLDGVGLRLRRARLRRRLSLRRLAEAAGLSASHLSAIERGISAPSLATLQKLTANLDVNLVTLLGAGLRGQALVRRGEGFLLRTGTPGVRIEHLGPTARTIEPQLFTVAPGAGSGGAYTHDGEEFLYVLEGRLELWLAPDERFDVASGDALGFPSTRAHRWSNPGTVTAVVLWINTPPTF